MATMNPLLGGNYIYGSAAASTLDPEMLRWFLVVFAKEMTGGPPFHW